MTIIHHLALLLLFPLFFTTTAYGESSTTTYGNYPRKHLCIYNLYIKTSGRLKAPGTDFKISVSLENAKGGRVMVPNIELWGLMGSKHKYFERGNLDIFSGMASCITSPICRLNLTSDDSGRHDSWYCKYVEVTLTTLNKECSQTIFHVNRWLSKTIHPYNLTAIIDRCKPSDDTTSHNEYFVDTTSHNEYFVVGNSERSVV